MECVRNKRRKDVENEEGIIIIKRLEGMRKETEKKNSILSLQA